MRGIIFEQMVSFGNASHGTLTNAGEELPEGNLNREQRHITSELPAISNNLDTLAIPMTVLRQQGKKGLTVLTVSIRCRVCREKDRI